MDVSRFRIPLLILLLICCACSSRLRLLPGEFSVEDCHGDSELRSLAGPGVFVGVSHECRTEADARAEAERNARAMIIQSLESRLSSSIVDSILLHGRSGTILSPDVYTEARLTALANNVIAVSPRAYYIERGLLGAETGVIPVHVAWCRMDYPREQHHRLLAEHLDRLEVLAGNDFQAIETAWATGNWKELLGRAGSLLRGLRTLQDNYSGFSPGQTARMALLDRKLRSRLSRVDLSVQVSSVQAEGNEIAGLLSKELAGRLGERLPFRIQTDAPGDLTLTGILRFRTHRVMAGLVRAEALVELKLSDRDGSTLLWQRRSSLIETGGTAEIATRKLLKQAEEPRNAAEEWAQELCRSLGLSITEHQ